MIRGQAAAVLPQMLALLRWDYRLSEPAPHSRWPPLLLLLQVYESAVPFGGYRSSGIGRDKGEYALEVRAGGAGVGGGGGGVADC